MALPAASAMARDGIRIVSIYFAIVYAFPLVGNTVLGGTVLSSYEIYPLTIGAVTVLVGTYALFRIFVAVASPGAPRLAGPFVANSLDVARRLYRRVRLYVGLIALPLAVLGLSGGLTSYRYANEGISAREAAGLLVLIVVYVLASVDMFYFMFVRDAARPQGRRQRVEHFLMAGTLVIAANGIATLLQALFTLVYAIWPRRFRQVIFLPLGASPFEGLRRASVALPVFVIVFAIAWYGGTVIKLSSGADMDALVDNPTRVVSVAYTHDSVLESVAHYVVERASVYYYSFLFTENVPRAVLLNGAESTLLYPLQTLLFRIDFVLGHPMGLEKPETGTIMQLNYQLLTTGYLAERAGTAPGLIAAFTYALPMPFNVVACALFLWWLAYALADLLRSSGERLSSLGALLALQSVLGVFSSPFDWLILLDNEVLYVGLLFVLLLAKRQELACAALGLVPAFQTHPTPIAKGIAR